MGKQNLLDNVSAEKTVESQTRYVTWSKKQEEPLAPLSCRLRKERRYFSHRNYITDKSGYLDSAYIRKLTHNVSSILQYLKMNKSAYNCLFLVFTMKMLAPISPKFYFLDRSLKISSSPAVLTKKLVGLSFKCFSISLL